MEADNEEGGDASQQVAPKRNQKGRWARLSAKKKEEYRKKEHDRYLKKKENKELYARMLESNRLGKAKKRAALKEGVTLSGFDRRAPRAIVAPTLGKLRRADHVC